MSKQLRLLMLAVMTLLISVGVQAQITTASMGGRVIDDMGDAVIGASVRAVHEPSGSVYGAVTNVDGRYAIQGMRTGGPYTVTVSYVGYATKTFTNLTMQLGEIFNLNVDLSENAEVLGEVVVTATASKFAAEKTGAVTNINQNTIVNLPTVSRSISDVVKMSPYSGGGMSFAGGDGRSTNFTVDGANFNNNFGLSSALPGGGTPISIDAIEEMQVVVTPFDVRQTNFIGGGVNAVTKSGTNTFKGTAYTYYKSENLHGTRLAGVDAARTRDRQYTYGATLGGPIIKNKLFFFVNAEYTKTPGVVNRWRASTDGKADKTNYISRTTLADMQRVSEFVKSKYGYDTGSATSFPADESNKKLLVRLDWNITQDHHLAVRYNYTKNTAWNSTNGNSSNTGYRLNGMNRLSEYSMAFANSMYSMDNVVKTISADLNSHFGSNLSNQLLFTYTKIDDIRGSNSSPFPFIDIMAGYTTAADGTVTQTLEPYMSLGYELFTWNNGVHNNVTTITDNFTAYLGAHKLTAGFSFEHQMANNAYMRNGTGYYRYRSLDDFLNSAAPEAVALTYGYDGEKNPAAQVRFNQYGLYVQDEWSLGNTLKLTGGIRFDNISFNDDDVMTNNAIKALDYGGKHVDTGAWPKTNIQISPRFGFTWDVFGDKRLKIRGGTGLFAGRLPLVFFTNMPTNSNMVQYASTNVNTKYKNGVVSSRDPKLDQFAGRIVTDINEMVSILGTPTTIKPEDGAVGSEVNGVAHDFKMPQVWKSSIGIDYQIPVSFPLTVTGEFNYTKNINAVQLINWNIMENTSTWERFQGADNRLIYPANYTYTKTNAFVLSNTHKGYGWTANVTVNATPLENLDIMAAYTHTVMKEVTGMPGSNATSAWQGLYTVDGPNFAKVQNSQYVTPDRLIASVSYTYGKDHFSLFYTGYSAGGYSYYYSNDMNGDGINTDLMYIPRNDSEINFKNEADRADFWAYVEQDDYLKNHKGEYAEAYSARAPWVHQFDFRWAHDFTLKVGNTNHRLQLSADIENIGNMIHSSWGVPKYFSAGANNGRILKYEGKDANNVPTFSLYRDSSGNAPTQTWDYNRAYGNAWRIQFGVKYYFN